MPRGGRTYQTRNTPLILCFTLFESTCEISVLSKEIEELKLRGLPKIGLFCPIFVCCSSSVPDLTASLK